MPRTRTRTLVYLLAPLALAAAAALLLVQRTNGDSVQVVSKPVRKRGSGKPPGAFAVVPASAGVNAWAPELTGEDMERMRAAGFSYVRFDMRWSSSVETVKGRYDWQHYDMLDKQLRRVGLNPIYLLAYSNDHYNTDGFPFNEVAEREGFKAFAVAAVRRYDRPGVIWELGNEQDTYHFWPTREEGNSPGNARVRARDYMKLVKLTVPAMRKESPKAVVISGGVLDINWRVTRAWLEEAFKLGAPGLFDGLGIHMYGKPPAEPEERMLDGLSALRKSLVKSGAPRGYPVFQTEFGVGLHNDHLSGPLDKRLLQQAQVNLRVYLLSLMEGLRVNVWYEWRRKDPRSDDERGMVSPRGKERPTYVAARTAFGELAGFSFDSRHPLGSDDDFALLFTKGDERKLAAWTADAPHKLSLFLHGKPAHVSVTSMLGATRKAAAPGGKLTLPVSASPTYVGWRAVGGAGAKAAR